MAKDKALTGAAGEYYVAFRLAEAGYAVGLTPRGTASVDLVVANASTGKSVTIQTKTATSPLAQGWWNWRVGKNRRQAHRSFFYVFVDLKKNDQTEIPDAFIVPSTDLGGRYVSLVAYPHGAELGSPAVKDVWCGIAEKYGPKYRNNWEAIDRALT